MQLRQAFLSLLWSGFTAPCLAKTTGNGTAMAVELAPQSMGGPPECAALKTSAVDDPRWNTQSPDIEKPLCKGTWWFMWPAINWEITIPNDHIFDAASIAANEHACGSSVYDLVPWRTLKTWIQCDMRGTTGYLQFRVITATETATIGEAFNKGTCNTFTYVNCFKKRGSWGLW